MNAGLVRKASDLYSLDVQTLAQLDRMGLKSAQNAVAAIDRSKQNDLSKLLCALGIRQIGTKAARVLAQRFGSMDALMNATVEELTAVDDIGEITAQFLQRWFADGQSRDLIESLKNAGVNMTSTEAPQDLRFAGKTFVLTGSLTRFTREPARGADFSARVFKISRDAQGTRLTHLKVTGGTLRAKMQLPCGKADQLRLYSGAKFRPLDAAGAGEVVAVTGLADTYPGQGLGAEADGEKPVLQSVLTYRILLPGGTDAHTVLPKLHELEDEDPMLRIVWEEASGELHAELMGEVQLEILQRLISDRFGLSVTFGEGSIVYKEAIANTVEGVGHFEPLRHYAEVHLLLEPAPRGSGVQLASTCPTDELDLNWQRLILTHLAERAHPGVLTGSALTDVKMTLLAGRAHLKHTEGGDFRQATYRAVRQGLMQAESVLLEPFYDFRLELPPECVGRAMTDLAAMGGSADAPETVGEETVLTGFAPVK